MNNLYKDISVFSIYSNKDDILKASFLSSYIDGISTHDFFIPKVKECLSNLNTCKIASVIDYPYGISDIKTRNAKIIQSIRKGANTIDLIINHHFLYHGYIKEIEEDLNIQFALCKKYKAELRPMIQWNIIPNQFLSKLCHIFSNIGIEHVFPTNGEQINQDVDDTILVCLEMQKQQIKTIYNGPLWLTAQYKRIVQSNISGIRTNSIKICEDMFVGV